jgi:hypothetical protein
MKPRFVLLALSLFANAAFVADALRSRASADAPPAGVAHANVTRPAKAAPGTSAELAEAFKSNNPVRLRDALRAAGLPESTIRSLVTALISHPYQKQWLALRPKPDPNQPWWKEGPNSWDWQSKLSRGQRAELRTLERAATNEITRVLGPEPEAYQGSRSDFLSADKRKTVAEIKADYQDLSEDVQQDMRNFPLPADAEKLKFILAEKKRDLAAILTPQEMADYELRSSDTADKLHRKLSKFDRTEDEYRKIFAIQKSFDDTQNLDAWGNPIDQSSEARSKQREAKKGVESQIKAALGAERYADYTRSQNYDYQKLVAATQRLSLPPETARQVYDLRDTVSSESGRIVDNPDLGVDQKKQLLADLAKSTRSQIRARLGDTAAEAYLKNSMSWLRKVESGNAVTFGEDGQSTGTRSIPAVKKPAAAK